MKLNKCVSVQPYRFVSCRQMNLFGLNNISLMKIFMDRDRKKFVTPTAAP